MFGYLNLNNLTKIQEVICFEDDIFFLGNVDHVSTNKVYTDISERKIENEVATIHAVKGETHAATLVLETKYHENDIGLLIDYILAENNIKPTAVRKIKFMKQLYVAFSRPKYLLCLAMDKSEFPEEHLGKQNYAGWRICDLTIV